MNLPQTLMKVESTAKEAIPLGRDVFTRSRRKRTKQVVSMSIHPSVLLPPHLLTQLSMAELLQITRQRTARVRLQTVLQSQLHSHSLTWVQTHRKEREVHLKLSGSSAQGAPHSTFLWPKSELVCWLFWLQNKIKWGCFHTYIGHSRKCMFSCASATQFKSVFNIFIIHRYRAKLQELFFKKHKPVRSKTWLRTGSMELLLYT